MVWLRDYARPALSTQDTWCDAFRVVRRLWAQCERLERYQPRHGHASERGIGDQLRLVIDSWGADEEQAIGRAWKRPGFVACLTRRLHFIHPSGLGDVSLRSDAGGRWSAT